MKKKPLNSTFWFVGIALLLPAMLFFGWFWYSRSVAPLPYFGANYSISSNANYTVPAYTGITQDSVPITPEFTKGKIWVANYFYTTCPTICPQMMNNLVAVQQAFEANDDVRMVSFSVNPDYDRPAILKTYASLRGIATGNWQLVTGNKRALYRFAREGLYITATGGDGGSTDFIHSEKLVLIDRDNHIRGYYDGTDTDSVDQLISDMQRLLDH